MASSLFIWVTRTSPYSYLTAHHLRAIGHKPLVAPVLAIRPLECVPFLRPPDALIFTSVHAVQHHPFRAGYAPLSVFTVGKRTGMTARDAGYRNVRSADGDVSDLRDLIRRELPVGANVVHLSAAEPAGDLVLELNRHGFRAEQVHVYESVETSQQVVSPALAALPWIDGIFIHSPKAARRIAAFISQCGVLWTGTSYCISEVTAQPLREVTGAPILVAAAPNEKAMIKLLLTDGSMHRGSSFDELNKAPRGDAVGRQPSDSSFGAPKNVEDHQPFVDGPAPSGKVIRFPAPSHRDTEWPTGPAAA
jgi:uroporphyrinogen-III synthase